MPYDRQRKRWGTMTFVTLDVDNGGYREGRRLISFVLSYVLVRGNV